MTLKDIQGHLVHYIVYKKSYIVEFKYTMY